MDLSEKATSHPLCNTIYPINLVVEVVSSRWKGEGHVECTPRMLLAQVDVEGPKMNIYLLLKEGVNVGLNESAIFSARRCFLHAKIE